MHSAHFSEAPVMPPHRPMPNFTREIGGTLHLVGVGDNRIGTVRWTKMEISQ
jgi:hypothetical protein